ncbi:hypothetical protein OG259_36800 [Streptomyces sp. NBC_00250]|uniref:hypothetical protein n=1 Tax=Streptomyces sp. NBC_00250 TaxID=2903641 RepID=UPI002E2D7A9D|nr:hypothetical protein [Streptomyces sp. NBC_00250]
MSNDIAYPVFRTPDPALALSVARRMVAFGVQPWSDVSVETEVSTLAEVKRLLDALPGAWFVSYSAPFDLDPDLARSIPEGELPPGLAEVAAFPPFTVSLQLQAVGSVEDRFTAAVGPHPAEVHWASLLWPEAPERDLHGEGKHAEVTLLLNCESIELDARTDTHLVLVHVRRRNGDGYEDRFAQWLAEQIGQEVIGPPQSS